MWCKTIRALFGALTLAPVAAASLVIVISVEVGGEQQSRSFRVSLPSADTPPQ